MSIDHDSLRGALRQLARDIPTVQIGVDHYETAARLLEDPRYRDDPARLTVALASLVASDADSWELVHSEFERLLAPDKRPPETSPNDSPPSRTIMQVTQTPGRICRRMVIAIVALACVGVWILGRESPSCTSDGGTTDTTSTTDPAMTSTVGSTGPETGEAETDTDDPPTKSGTGGPPPDCKRVKVEDEVTFEVEGSSVADVTDEPDEPPLDTPWPWLLGSFLFAFAGARLLMSRRAHVRAHEAQRQRLTQERRELSARSFGSGRLYIVPQQRWLDRGAVDDAATILGRRIASGSTDELDVDRSVDEAARRAGHVHPRRAARRVQAPLVVLVDCEVGHHHRLDALEWVLERWRVTGLEFHRYNFPHRPDLQNAGLFEAVHDGGPFTGQRVTLETLARRHAGARLLLCSRLERAHDPGRLDGGTVSIPWLRKLVPWTRRVWLDLDGRPLTDGDGRRARAHACARGGLYRAPFSERGVVAAASYLVGHKATPRASLDLVLRSRRALARALELWAGCAALVPDATWTQLEDLRQAHRATILKLTGQDLSSSSHVLRLIEWVARQHRQRGVVPVGPQGEKLVLSGDMARWLKRRLRNRDMELARRVHQQLADQLEAARQAGELSARDDELAARLHDFHLAVIDRDKLARFLEELAKSPLQEDFVERLRDELDLQARGLGAAGWTGRELEQVARVVERGERVPVLDVMGRLGGRGLMGAAAVAAGLVAVAALVSGLFFETSSTAPADRTSTRIALPTVYRNECPDQPEDEVAREVVARCSNEDLDAPPTGGVDVAGAFSVSLGEGVEPMAFVGLSGGAFSMGSRDGEGYDDERPRHRVCLSPFAIATHEVTQGQYEAVMGENPSDCEYGCGKKLPVQRVNWEDAVKFLNRLTARENELRAGEDGWTALTECYDEQTWAWDEECTGYRLPTEAEREYAARAGSTGAYSFGDDATKLGRYAWYDANAGGEVHEVGTKQPNRWGLADMRGNVYEWTFDGYASYSAEAARDPVNKKTATYRVLRGGSFNSGASWLRSADRYWNGPSNRDWDGGFRCVRGPRPQRGA